MSAALQNAFAISVRDASCAAPASIGAAAGRRFAVYRNNVAVSLAGALATRFPAVKAIVGEDFFAGLARAFVDARPPRSPVMMVYGDDFPEFLEGFPGLEDVPYLADVARLEAARTRAYHAANAVPLGPEAFAALDAEALDRTAVALHPSMEIVRSAHPLVTIWAMNAGEAELGPIADWHAEDALVARPAMDVVVRRLPPGGAAFLSVLATCASLADAAEAAAGESPDFDLTQNLVGLIGAGLATGFREARAQGAGS